MHIDVERLVQHMLGMRDTPWVHQGRSAEGVDCLGLAVVALQAQGLVVDAKVDYPRRARGERMLQALEASGMFVAQDISEPMERGDVLVFRIRHEPQHVAIATAADRMLHADMQHGVREVTLSPLWAMRLVARYSWAQGV